MSTKTKNKPAKPQNGTPSEIAPLRQWEPYERMADDMARADADLARRVKSREALAPIIEAIASALSQQEREGKIEDVKLQYFEPGEYGDEQVHYPERIQFSWNVTGFNGRYSNTPNFSITLMESELVS
jgi:hypothetical protein